MDRSHRALDRRSFLGHTLRGGAGLALAGGLGALLAACGQDDGTVAGPAGGPTPGAGTATAASPAGPPVGNGVPDDLPPEGLPLLGDIIDFALTSDEWPGAFGFVTLRLHRGLVDGAEVGFIRTDASDEAFANQEGLVFVPKLRPLNDPALSGALYLVEGDQPAVLSSQPGVDGYTPAWRVHRVRFTGEPRALASVDDVEAAAADGAADVEETGVVMNAAVVTWSGGALAVDDELDAYLGPGQLIEPPDLAGGRVIFKLQECFPSSRYIVTDHSVRMAAEMTRTALAPGLQDGPFRAGATGRTNVFMNGIPGPGPMGFQPSAFDFAAGHPDWSPYWDHFTYAWVDGVEPRVLTSQAEIHAARDAGELEEFPGTPDTGGEFFTVNCPTLVLAPNSFTG